jgi:type IV pilus assembly protein PilB
MHKPLLKPRPRLGDLLVRQGFLTDERLQVALKLQADTGANKLLGEVLVERDFCSEEQVLECLAIEFKLPFVRLEPGMFDPKIVELLPRDVLEKHQVLPLFKLRDTLTVAVAEPSDIFLLDRLKAIARCEVQLAIASARDIRRALQTSLTDTQLFVIDTERDALPTEALDLIEATIDELQTYGATRDSGGDDETNSLSSVARLVNHIFATAVAQGASDIHIEPTDRQVRVRFRVDGSLYKALELPSHVATAIVNRIKRMASLDISEHRLPKDGRIHVVWESRSIDLRASTMPLAHGEKTVIHVMDSQNTGLSLTQLGFSRENLERFQEQIHSPSGMVLVTGPSGSGKSTTLYAALNTVTSLETNVCTVEDPVEFSLPLINQFQVNERLGLTFASTLRNLLRQDPDVLMLGDMRDEETVRLATQVASSGRRLFGTLQAPTAVAAIMRLNKLGIDGYQLGEALNAVLAQRLCRRICEKCKVAYEPNKAMLAVMQQVGLECHELFRGTGCSKCRQTGFSGRIAIHELLVVDDVFREGLALSPTTQMLNDYAQRRGMIPLRNDGLRKVREGLTTIEEVLQATEHGWQPTRAQR